MMAKLKNTTARIFNLPGFPEPGQQPGAAPKMFGGDLALLPGRTLEVPDWYIPELRKEKHWARRLSADGVVSQSRRLGSIDPADVEADKRREAKRRAEREAGDRARRAEEGEQSRRVAELGAGSTEATITGDEGAPADPGDHPKEGEHRPQSRRVDRRG
jgi:hypothetical protein